MGAELDRPGIEGKIVTGGIAQSVTREGNLTRIRLTCVPGAIASPRPGVPYKVEFPEPVTVGAGEWVAVEIDWLPFPAREEAGQPMYIRDDCTLTNVWGAPSAALPGTTQGLVG